MTAGRPASAATPCPRRGIAAAPPTRRTASGLSTVRSRRAARDDGGHRGRAGRGRRGAAPVAVRARRRPGRAGTGARPALAAAQRRDADAGAKLAVAEAAQRQGRPGADARQREEERDPPAARPDRPRRPTSAAGVGSLAVALDAESPDAVRRPRQRRRAPRCARRTARSSGSRCSRPRPGPGGRLTAARRVVADLKREAESVVRSGGRPARRPPRPGEQSPSSSPGRTRPCGVIASEEGRRAAAGRGDGAGVQRSWPRSSRPGPGARSGGGVRGGGGGGTSDGGSTLSRPVGAAVTSELRPALPPGAALLAAARRHRLRRPLRHAGARGGVRRASSGPAGPAATATSSSSTTAGCAARTSRRRTTT